MNKIKYGLKNVHYAKVTVQPDGSVLYGPVKAIPGAVTLALTSTAEKQAIAADDDPEYAILYDNKGYEGDLEIQEIPDTFRVDILGEEVDENGVQSEGKDVTPANVALLFEISGDKNKTRHVMYNCSVTKPDLNTATKGESIENQTDSLSLTATPAKDTGKIKSKATSDSGAYSTWFNSVYVVGGEAPVLVSPTEFLFDKKVANQKACVINLFLDGQTFSNIKNNGVALTSTTHYVNDSGVITIKTAYLNTLTVGSYDLVFNFSDGSMRVVTITVIDSN